MMKKIVFLTAMPLLMAVLASCSSKDEFTDSIFDTSVPAVDQTKSTAEFDQWLYDNFVVPYNVQVNYRFDQAAADKRFVLTPANYKRSQLLAHLIMYLYYDVYTKYAGEDFMKQYGPRIFQFIGSSGYSATQGTEVLGTASGGVKITLYNINEMKEWSEGTEYDGADVEVLNERFFHTMHHEFSHILHQTKSYPVTFGQVTSGTYDPQNWQKRDSVTTHQLGYVTHYASSANYEDFVETLSGIITDTPYRWMMRIINATSMGVRNGDKAEILDLCEKLNINIDQADAHWNNFKLYKEKEYNTFTGQYDDTERYVLDVHRLIGDPQTHEYQVMNKEQTDYVDQYKYTELRSFTSFRNDFLPWVSISTKDDLAGINAMLKKISIATTWYTEKWGLDAFTLRKEVSDRQDNINEYMKNNVVFYDLK